MTKITYGHMIRVDFKQKPVLFFHKNHFYTDACVFFLFISSIWNTFDSMNLTVSVYEIITPTFLRPTIIISIKYLFLDQIHFMTNFFLSFLFVTFLLFPFIHSFSQSLCLIVINFSFCLFHQCKLIFEWNV